MATIRALCAATSVSVCACGSDPSTGGSPRTSGEAPAATAGAVPLTLARSRGGVHDGFTVEITTRHTTGVKDKALSHYTVAAEAVRFAAGCVVEQDQRFPDRPAGIRVRATLDPSRGKGGHLGWCPGLYRGTITYFEGFACPREGTCRAPNNFPRRTEVVGRFAFRVS